MSHILVIPKELVMEMCVVKRENGISIREQVIDAIKDYLDGKEKLKSVCNRGSLIFKPVDDRTCRVFNRKTGSFHDPELGIDIVL